jgi:hypothetical protein
MRKANATLAIIATAALIALLKPDAVLGLFSCSLTDIWPCREGGDAAESRREAQLKYRTKPTATDNAITEGSGTTPIEIA